MVARQKLDDAKSKDWNYYKSMGSKAPAQDRDNRIAEKTQEVANLENQLTSLQQQRDQVVSSATMSYAEAIVGKPEEAKSILSVLSQIQNVKLEMPDMSEVDLAKMMDDINLATQQGQASLLDYTSTLGDNDLALRAYIESLDGGKASISGFNDFIQQHNKGVKASGLAAKAAAVGHAVLNAAISLGASLLISWAMSAITKAINAHKELAESVRETISEYNRATKTLKEHYNTIEEIKDDYADLADGVDSLGRNISLSADEYERYHEITNQIAEMFPEMVSGYTEEGNAIIALKGNVEELTKAYKEEAQAARDALLTKANDTFDVFKTHTNNNPITAFEDTGLFQQYKLAEKIFDLMENGDIETIEETWDKLNSSNFKIDGQTFSNIEKNALFETAGINEDDFQSSWDGSINLVEFKEQQKLLLAGMRTIKSKIDAELSPIKSMVNAYLLNDEGYQNLSDEGKNIAQAVISGFDAEFYNRDGFIKWTDVASWIDTNVIQKLQNTENMAQFNAVFDLQTQFNDGTVPVDEYIPKVVLNTLV